MIQSPAGATYSGTNMSLLRNSGRLLLMMLLAHVIGKLRDTSERIRAFHLALNKSEASLP